MMGVTIRGIQEAQRANQRLIAAVQFTGALGRGVHFITTQVHRRAVYNTPWDTGGLRAAHRMQIEMGGSRGRIFIDPAAINPRQGNERPAKYGADLHEQGMIPGVRGGIRAFYQFTAEHEGPIILEDAAAMIRRELP